MNKLVTLFLLCCAFSVVNTAKGQLAYSLKTTPGTSLSEYTPLNNGTPIMMDWSDTYIFPPDNEVRTIPFFNKPFTLKDTNLLYVVSNGNIDIFSESEGVIVDVFNTELDSLAPGAAVRYTREFEAGENILKIEWKDMSLQGCPQSRINCQLWIYETTGIIEMHYGTIVTTCDSVFTGPFVGIFKGNRDFSANYKLNWLKGDPAAPTLTTANFVALKGVPSFGTVYQLTPTSLNQVQPSTQVAGLCYPNPATDKLTISIPSAGELATITLIDVTGKEVLQMQSSEAITNLDLGRISKGMYIVEVSRGSETLRQSFIKE